MSALDELMAEFKANNGAMPPVNPPQAAKVLAEKTAPETAGETVPELPPVIVPAPVEKPPEVVAAENAVRPKRTAKVVQAELDTALARIEGLEDELKSALEKLDAALARLAELETAQKLGSVLIDSNLTEELRTSEERNEQLTRTTAEREAQAAKIIKTLQTQIETLQAAKGAQAVHVSGQETIDELHENGWTVQLTYRGQG